MGELLNSSLFFQKSPISFEQTESTNSIAQCVISSLINETQYDQKYDI